MLIKAVFTLRSLNKTELRYSKLKSIHEDVGVYN